MILIIFWTIKNDISFKNEKLQIIKNYTYIKKKIFFRLLDKLIKNVFIYFII